MSADRNDSTLREALYEARAAFITLGTAGTYPDADRLEDFRALAHEARKKVEAALGIEDTTSETCPTCSGSGRARNRIYKCMACAGTGEVTRRAAA